MFVMLNRYNGAIDRRDNAKMFTFIPRVLVISTLSVPDPAAAVPWETMTQHNSAGWTWVTKPS